MLKQNFCSSFRISNHLRAWVAGCILLICSVLPAFAAEFVTQAREAILFDAGSGEILFEKNADALMPPASMSKLMTATMVFEAIKSRDLSMDDEFFISENAWRRGGARSGGSTMYAEINSTVKIRDLIQGVVIQSANDACIALAEGIAGTEEAFADLMTQRARELGMEKSTFKNATGLPDPEHRMTARELGNLARHMIYNLGEFYHYFAQAEFTWNNIKQRNRNPLLRMNMGADGLKTGYTRKAGYGLVASAQRSGRRLIMVIGGLKSSKKRKVEARKLMEWGFRRFRNFSMFEQGQTVGHARVWGGDETWVELVAEQPIELMLTPNERKAIKADIVYEGPLRAPVEPGAQIGKLRFSVNGKPVSEVKLYGITAVEADKRKWKRAIDTLMFMALGG